MKKGHTFIYQTKLKKPFWIALFSILFFSGRAQYQLPIYTDYLTDNYYLLHPAMAGAHFEGAKVRLTHRSQWQGVQNAPNLQTLNAHSRLWKRTGFGAAFYRDQNGFQSRVGGLFTYSYHINFFRSNVEINQLSFGLSVGGVNSIHDQTTFDPFLGDPLLTGTKERSSSLHMDMGFSYNRIGLYAHLTIKNLLFKGNNISDAVALEKPRSMLLNAGYFVELSPKWALEPSFMFQTLQYANIPGYDLNLKSHHHRRNLNAWVGLSYRAGLDTNAFLNAGTPFDQKHQQLTTLVGAVFGVFSFSYSYTQSLEAVNFRAFSSHQLTLGIDITSDKFRTYPIRGLF